MLEMDDDQKINMALDDIIKLERMKKENDAGSFTSRKSGMSFRSTGTHNRHLPMQRDPNKIQNLYYTRNGPLGRRNNACYSPFQRSPFRRMPVGQYRYLRNKVRYATQFLNLSQQAQRHMLQAPVMGLVTRSRALALKRLQNVRAYKRRMAARSSRNSDNLSVVIPNEMAVRRMGAMRGKRTASQLTVRNMRKFNALSGNVEQAWNNSIYSSDIQSRRSHSASVGRHSHSRTPTRNYVGSVNGWKLRRGTPANSEVSGYSVGNYHSRLLNYTVQRKIAMLQSKTVPVDTSGRPVIICNGLGLDFNVNPVGTSKPLHERIAIMLQKF